MSNNTFDLTNTGTSLISQLNSYGGLNSNPNYSPVVPGGNGADIVNPVDGYNGGTDFWSFDNWFGSPTQGNAALAPTVLNSISGLGNLFLGMRQYGLARDQFDESVRQFSINNEMQRSDINRNLEDRQRARLAANPNAYQSVGDYMDQYRV